MNNKEIDKTKKSNIKCEHCKYWQDKDVGDGWRPHYLKCCCCADSIKFDKPTNYYNRCKCFDWKEK